MDLRWITASCRDNGGLGPVWIVPAADGLDLASHEVASTKQHQQHPLDWRPSVAWKPPIEIRKICRHIVHAHIPDLITFTVWVVLENNPVSKNLLCLRWLALYISSTVARQTHRMVFSISRKRFYAINLKIILSYWERLVRKGDIKQKKPKCLRLVFVGLKVIQPILWALQLISQSMCFACCPLERERQLKKWGCLEQNYLFLYCNWLVGEMFVQLVDQSVLRKNATEWNQMEKLRFKKETLS